VVGARRCATCRGVNCIRDTDGQGGAGRIARERGPRAPCGVPAHLGVTTRRHNASVEADHSLGDLVPELDVTDMAKSIAFYVLLGFRVTYERPEEGFAFLVRSGAALMLQVAEGPGRRFRTAPLARPF